MKRFIILLCLCLIVFTACANDNNKDETTPINMESSTNDVSGDEDDAGTSAPPANANTVTVEEKVLLDQKDVVITLKSLETDSFIGLR